MQWKTVDTRKVFFFSSAIQHIVITMQNVKRYYIIIYQFWLFAWGVCSLNALKGLINHESCLLCHMQFTLKTLKWPCVSAVHANLFLHMCSLGKKKLIDTISCLTLSCLPSSNARRLMNGSTHLPHIWRQNLKKTNYFLEKWRFYKTLEKAAGVWNHYLPFLFSCFPVSLKIKINKFNEIKTIYMKKKLSAGM